MYPVDGQSLLPHTFPIAVGSTMKKEGDAIVSLSGMAITLNREGASASVTDEKKEISIEEKISF
jgi:hypothetical protein